jgi:hypothetical protein
VKRGLVHSPQKRASAIHQEREDLDYEISSFRCNLQLNGYHQSFIDSDINLKGSSIPKKQVRSLGSVYISYVKGISEKLKLKGTILRLSSE